VKALALCFLLVGGLLLIGGPAVASAQDPRMMRLQLEHGAFVRDDAPEAIAHVPLGVDATQPLAVVIFLHGYTGCVEVLASDAPDARCRPRDRSTEGWGLVAAHERAGTRTIFLMPQLAFMERSGHAGRFGRTGEAARFVEEALAQLTPLLGRPVALRDVASVTLLAHSAAFETTIAIVRHGGLDAQLRHVVLFDALYGGREVFLEWVAHASASSPRTLVSFATGARTLAQQRQLYATAHRRWPDATFDEPDFASPLPAGAPRLVVTRRAHVAHSDVPARYLAETLRALGLPMR
jgi:hypothetical protein